MAHLFTVAIVSRKNETCGPVSKQTLLTASNRKEETTDDAVKSRNSCREDALTISVKWVNRTALGELTTLDQGQRSRIRKSGM